MVGRNRRYGSAVSENAELADQIERELRIVETQQAPGNDAADSFLSNGVINSQATAVEAEVDGLLENQLTSN